MKSIPKLIFLLLTFFLPATAKANAYDIFNENGIYYIINYDEISVSVTHREWPEENVYSGNISIPAVVTHDGKTYSVTRIGNCAFSNCKNLMSVTIPNSVRYIDTYAFDNSGLTNITIPNSVGSIGEKAFADCSEITSVIINGNLSSVAERTFYNCRKLKTVVLPYSVTQIGTEAFYLCEELTDVTCLAKTPPVIADRNCFYPGCYMATLHVPERSVNAYKASTYWRLFSDIKGDAIEGGSSDDSDYMKCDVNGDGEVNIADVNRIIDAILSH